MKTKFALAFYYLSIGSVVIFGGVIAMKLIFWPPCTQMGHDCVVDGWSVAGLAGTILAVAATVLAVLGAVAVAAWWTSLNVRVNDQVKNLYEAQREEVNTQINRLLQEQEKKVNDQLKEFQAGFVEVQAGIERSLALADQTARTAEEEKKLLDNMSANFNRFSEEFVPVKKSAQEFTAFMDHLSKLAKNTPAPGDIAPIRITSTKNNPSST